MKKLITLFFAIVLFGGCIPVPTEVQPTNNEPDTAIEPETNIEGEVQTLAITENEDTYTINVQYPQLNGLDELNERLKTMALTEINAFKDQMADLEIDEEIENEFLGSTLEANYEIYRNDEAVFSVAHEYYVYMSGAAHPYTYTTTLNWDGEKEIEWVDIISGDQDIPLILSEMVKADENVVDDWIEEGAGPDAANFDNFTITPDSLVIHFDPYEIAAYAAGPQKVEITFEDLGVLLNPEFGA
ncbi:DUF3298 and DUF4163 domain-containing protein [Patescibacteria group bacterium]